MTVRLVAFNFFERELKSIIFAVQQFVLYCSFGTIHLSILSGKIYTYHGHTQTRTQIHNHPFSKPSKSVFPTKK